MKRTFKTVLLVFFCLMITVGLAVTAYFGIEQTESGELLFFGMTADELQIYVKDRILPLATGIATAVATVYVAIVPAITRIKSASGRFEQATADVNSASVSAKESRAHVALVGEELRADMQKVREEYAAIDRKLDEMEKALLIAFSNNRELTANGSATAISHVLHDNLSAGEVNNAHEEADVSEN